MASKCAIESIYGPAMMPGGIITSWRGYHCSTSLDDMIVCKPCLDGAAWPRFDRVGRVPTTSKPRKETERMLSLIEDSVAARVYPELRRWQLRPIVDHFANNGFSVIPQLFDPQGIVEVRETIDQLFSHYRRLPAGHIYDLDHLPNGAKPRRIPAIRDTLRLRPQLRAIRGLASAVAWAERLVEPGAEVLWDAAIYKPSGSSSETPWHQDEAVFRLSGKGKPRWIVYFWIALDDVDADCGAIRFLPGSHRGPLLPHTWRGGDSSSSLVVAGTIDDKEAVTVPLGAGDATVHHLRTMHGSGVNLSDRCRKAWVLGVGKPKYPRWLRRLKSQVTGWGRRSPGQRQPREEGATEV